MAFHPKPAHLGGKEKETEETATNKQSLSYWRTNFTHKLDERGPFYGCHHPDSTCEEASCSCFTLKLPCEKICTCPPKCTRKFQGCICKHAHRRKGQRIVCFEDDRCICFNLGRECDSDLCGECGVDLVLDPVNRYDDEVVKGKCQNASIQRGRPKQTLIGESGIHGLGLFAGEQIKMHDFVGEYKGEIITKEEAERRGSVYEHQKLSYLFVLNEKQEVDSTYFGNDIRFINHAAAGGGENGGGPGMANLYPRIFLVGAGVHRIALFAERDIRKGMELLFDYGPKFPNEQLGGGAAEMDGSGVGKEGGGTRKKKKRRVRTKGVTEKVWDVVVEQDGDGYTRARKAMGARGAERVVGAKVHAATGKRVRRGATAADDGAAEPENPTPPRKGADARKQVALQAGPFKAGAEDAQAQDENSVHRSPEDRLHAYNIADEGPEEDNGAGRAADEEESEFEYAEETARDSSDSLSDSDGDDESVGRRRSRRGADVVRQSLRS